MYRKEILFGVAKVSKNFWGMPDISDIFLCEQKMLGPSLRMKKKMRVHSRRGGGAFHAEGGAPVNAPNRRMALFTSSRSLLYYTRNM